ncbi:hypothetical protein I4U23_013328 [Adineta vaga]|nr:hypothetical protein I4U23_013328 [Adineta vaga]
MSARRCAVNSEIVSHECLSSSSHLQIILDDHSECDSMFDDFSDQTEHRKTSTTKDQQNQQQQQRRKRSTHKTPKPHRLIEKRRRDRMNTSLGSLLELIPHKRSENQRRIEKTEIIEMAITHIRNLVSSNQKAESINPEKQSLMKLDAYRSGYYNSICDTYEYLEKHPPHNRILPDFIQFSTEKEIELTDLTLLPERKKLLDSKPRPSNSDEHMCTISNVQTVHDHDNIFQFSIDDEENSIEKTKVPIFVLHPSGTHYIPMSIDSSIVSHAFNKKSNLSHSSSMNEQFHCHPVSIPVNFNPISAMSDTYELDIQNINVIARRHQTSVRLN